MPASSPMCSFFQARRVFVPCFSISHSPAPHSFRPVLSTSRCTGSRPVLRRSCATSNVSALRHRVVWSGMARGEYQGCPPGVMRGSAAQAAIASSVNQTVKLRRWRRLAS